MARKRDHKAEYARRKAKAQKLGYTGVRDYRKTRAEIKSSVALPRSRANPSKRVVQRFLRITDPIGTMRKEAKTWSDAHSRSSRSEYRDDMSPEELRKYHRAYVQFPENLSRRKAAAEKRRRIGEYILEYGDVGEDEWRVKYELMPVG